MAARAQREPVPDGDPWAIGPAPPQLSPRHHGHLWRTPDGVGLHAPYGELVRDDEGLACCHLCGRFFRALGSHVRVHGHTGQSYRAAMGLPRRGGMAAPAVAQGISARQKTAYDASATVRARMALGQQLARTGELNRLANASDAWAGRRTTDRRRDAAARGRRAQQQRVLDRVAAITNAEISAPHSLPALRQRYEAGAGVAELAMEFSVSRRTVQRLLTIAEARLRGSGENTSSGRTSRARDADAKAAARIGVDDIASWLSTEHARGVTLTDLGHQVGHSYHWVRWRIDRAAVGDGTAPTQ